MTRVELPADAPQSLLAHPAVAAVGELARARGCFVLLVGGAVRDVLLGEPVKDLDFAVQGDPVSLGRAVANLLGGDFFVMDAERRTARAILHPSSFILDFAACRGATWEEDLWGRDFTVNAIALDIRTGAVIDPTGGRQDLASRIIRHVTPGSIGDDPVRALRAVRMALALDAGIEPATMEAVRAAGPRLAIPSPERIRDETLKILAHPRAARGVRHLDQLGLLGAVVPEVEPMRTCEQSAPHRFDALEHTLVVLDYLDRILAAATAPGADASRWHLAISDQHRAKLAAHFAAATSGDHTRAALYRLAVLLHDSGKPRTRTVDAAGVTHFYSHPLIGAELASARAGALRLSNEEARLLHVTILHHMRPNLLARSGGLTPRALYRLARDAGDCLPELALLCAADGMGKAGEQTKPEDRERRGKMASLLIEQYYTRFAAEVAAPPLITGRDVLAIGIEPGSRVGRILEAVREAQMAGEVRSHDEAVQLARELADLADHPPGPQAMP